MSAQHVHLQGRGRVSLWKCREVPGLWLCAPSFPNPVTVGMFWCPTTHINTLSKQLRSDWILLHRVIKCSRQISHEKAKPWPSFPSFRLMGYLPFISRLTEMYQLANWVTMRRTWHDYVIKREHFPRHWPVVSVTGEFPSQRPVTRSFDVFFDLRQNSRLSKQSRRRRFE